MGREEKKKLFSKQNMVAMFIVFIMVSSVIGYMFGKEGGEKFKYGDHSFLLRNKEFILKTDNEELSFDFFPADVDDIETDFDVSDVIKGVAEIDFTSDPDDKHAEIIALAQYRFQQVLERVSNTYVLNGMTSKNEFNLPVITCEDATESIPVLYFKKANVTSIILENNCIIAQAKSEVDILRVKDRLLYGLLGII
ncbi:hypothetical protein GOV06_04340 [Candidatus Woesearchaeota archaeon]|nr:hypothetical protein [Candidatus Woesearchaeota archaeon]